MRESVGLLLLLSACSGGDAMDAGTDTPRVERADAGFDPASLSPCTLAPSLGFDGAPYAGFTPLPASPTALRLFYPLVALEEDGHAAELAATAARRDALMAAADCAGEADCVRARLALDGAAASALSAEIADALSSSGTIGSYAALLRGSGVCARVVDGSDRALVAGCLSGLFGELSAALGVLGEIEPAALDGMLDALAREAPALPAWGPLSQALERGLALADRTEAIRYEPLDEEHGAALDAVPETDFDAFPYAAIVVLGQGPTDPSTALNPAGRARADLAFERWAAGLAPFVLLSGGHVHPDRTPFSEAVEMRRHLIEVRGMPASAIFVDPYARHTTTNLRNATRVLARAGVPMDRPLLVTSDPIQSIYVTSGGYASRCDESLGYRPFAALERLSLLDVCMLPSANSLHVAPSDPLDP
jgi:hypothetical protein